ncbi:hypothetical protein DFQ01_10356 [Paenibacillus cellulosilyticus]|uniref:Uncharacterized protein n=1 Tax=Paenibacillus cellulosilyticus TaxID=375489 RepID=A0A2V2YZA7_9BACL|nr:hypothetical protein [Paenibacillus cellulosilyticus]PWW06155.1 hypothetical protein DFQ01_10356 [Paenibacillus cellulosilyticus]QKS43076.1 hypothetical protein HUB94_00890 [Paenibacillus cellulosilyticus]
MYPVNQQGSQFQSNFQQQQPNQAGHYVQSHYQGQLSQPSFGQPGVIPSGYQSNSHQNFSNQSAFGGNQHYQQYTPMSQSLGPVISRVGWQAGPDLHPQHAQQPLQSHSYAQASTGGHYVAGPVISRYGYQAGQDSSGPVNQLFNQSNQSNQLNQGFYQPQHFGASHINTGYAAQSHTGQHPVYEATNAYNQAGPVISHFGGYESNQH